MSEDGVEDCDVIICGCGPTGALLSALLGRLRVKHVVLERELDITKDLFEDVGSGKITSLPPEKAWRSTKSGSEILHSDEHV